MASLRHIREQVTSKEARGKPSQEDDQDLEKEQDGDDNSSDKEDAKKGDKGKDDSSAPSRLRRMLQFRQYMRSENEDDRELMDKFSKFLKEVGNEWEREDHLDDLRPAIWLRKGDYVAEIYASLKAISATFGHLPKEEREEGEQDYTMMKLIFPPVVLPYEVEDEDTGEVEEDFDNAFEKLGEFLEECSDYIEKMEEEEEKNTEGKGKKKDKGSMFFMNKNLNDREDRN